MRRKRLQHCADTLCHKFCGWELIFSYKRLVELGSGTLEIDALSGECQFQGITIDQLTVAGAVRAWLYDDLAKNQIDPEELKCANVVADLELSTISATQRATHGYHMDENGRPIQSGDFYRLNIRCRSCVSTDEKAYFGAYSDIEEFPHGWPAA